MKNNLSIVILSEAKNLYNQFEKKTRFFVAEFIPLQAGTLRMTSLADFSEVSNQENH